MSHMLETPSDLGYIDPSSALERVCSKHSNVEYTHVAPGVRRIFVEGVGEIHTVPGSEYFDEDDIKKTFGA